MGIRSNLNYGSVRQLGQDLERVRRRLVQAGAGLARVARELPGEGELDAATACDLRGGGGRDVFAAIIALELALADVEARAAELARGTGGLVGRVAGGSGD